MRVGDKVTVLFPNPWAGYEGVISRGVLVAGRDDRYLVKIKGRDGKPFTTDVPAKQMRIIGVTVSPAWVKRPTKI